MVRSSRTLRPWLIAAAAAAVAAFSLALRYNDPEGEFAGLTDAHFFYAIRGWQMLFGDLPDRDYVEPGAPLTLAISAALQLIHRSAWSEYVFAVTLLAIAAGVTCAVATRASGSILLGVGAALFEIALFPRLYNYPKLIAYASTIFTLVPGDVIATGTPAGVGWSRKPQRFMKAGDVVEVELEGIGTLRNPVIAQA